MHLDLIPEARREILTLLKRRGRLPVEDIAEALDITVSGARQHLSGLERDGVVTYQRERSGPGRPRHLYMLTERGDALFPRNYEELINELLGYLQELDPAMVERVFVRRRQRRIQEAEQRLGGLTGVERVRALTSLLDDEGYWPELESLGPGRYRVSERNCRVRGVGECWRQACAAEVEFFRTVLPDADVRRTHHVVNGEPCCAYEIRFAEPRSGNGVHD